MFPSITTFSHVLSYLPFMEESESLNAYLGRFHYLLVAFSHFETSPGENFNLRLDL